ncbi:MAG: hypothetical protein KDE19_17535 [Caldilineaceae bacterium]|nr:hypothetical protein [Caldilineaceae bacterium]
METNETVPLFNPRHDKWEEHFVWQQAGTVVAGVSAIGRATVATLQMNQEELIPVRKLWVEAGWHPPQD